VRLIGIDTHEDGHCGYAEAAARMTQLVGGRSVTLTPGARDDRDRYGRLLRYINVGAVDVQLEMLNAGLAIARYDSRDGYGGHPRKDTFIAADNASPNVCSTPILPPPLPQPSKPTVPPVGVYYENCTAARAAGAAPIYIGQPGYRAGLDGDGDGVACE
jgi:Excalibur calcium-binding domain/Staphylococcal nuclease homologue